LITLHSVLLYLSGATCSQQNNHAHINYFHCFKINKKADLKRLKKDDRLILSPAGWPL